MPQCRIEALKVTELSHQKASFTILLDISSEKNIKNSLVKNTLCICKVKVLFLHIGYEDYFKTLGRGI